MASRGEGFFRLGGMFRRHRAPRRQNSPHPQAAERGHLGWVDEAPSRWSGRWGKGAIRAEQSGGRIRFRGRGIVTALALVAVLVLPGGDLLPAVQAASARTAGPRTVTQTPGAPSGPAPGGRVAPSWAAGPEPSSAASATGQIIVAPLPKPGPGFWRQPWSLKALVPDAVPGGPHLQLVRRLPTGALVLQVDEPGRLGEAVAALRRTGRFRYVQPNRVYHLAALPNDPYLPFQWGLHNVGQTIQQQVGQEDVDVDAPEAWDVTRGSSQVTVAVIDSGVDLYHPDLAGAFWTNLAEAAGQRGVDDDGNGYVDDVHGFDFYHRDATLFDPGDDEGHGTHVAGIIAGQTGDGRGIAGLAPDARLMVLKVFGPGGTTTTVEAIEAIFYAEAMGARIVNMSWGAPASDGDPALCEAIASSSMLFVAAAGNDGLSSDQARYYPAHCPADNLIAVAAVDNQGIRASFSNYGPAVAVAAPGVDILSTWPGGQYAYASGTSMAAPFVSGVAALAASRFPWLSPQGLRRQVLAAVKPVPGLEAWVAAGGIPSAARAVRLSPEEPEPGPGDGGPNPEPAPQPDQPTSDPEPPSPTEPPPPASPFPDVTAGMALYGEIVRAAELKLVDGYPGGRFRPDEPVTRQQFAKLMVRAFEQGSGRSVPTSARGAPDFPDVDETRGLGPYVAKMAAAGWMTGYEDGFFRPDRSLTRLETAVVVARVLSLPPVPHAFPDVRSRFDGQVGAVAAAGILRGFPSKDDPTIRFFRPDQSLTRAQAAAVAVRTYEALQK